MKDVSSKFLFGGVIFCCLILVLFLGGYLGSPSKDLGVELDKLSQVIFSVRTQEETLSMMQRLEDLQVLCKGSSEIPRLHFLKGMMHHQSGDVEEAISSWQSCHASRVKHHLSPLALLYAGMSLESLGRWREAADFFELHTKRYPKHFTGYESVLGLSRCLKHLSQKEESINVLQSHQVDAQHSYGPIFRQQMSFLTQDS